MRWVHRGLALSVLAALAVAPATRRASMAPSVLAARTLDVVRAHPAFAAALASARALDPHGQPAYDRAALQIELPRSADAKLRLETSSPGAWLEIAAATAPGTKAVVDDAVVFLDADPATDVVEIAGPSSAEELRVLRSPEAPSVVRYDVRLGPALSSIRVTERAIEVLDREGAVAIEAATPFAIDARGVRRDLRVETDAAGSTLVASLDTSDLAYPIVVDPEWKATASMSVARRSAAAVRLADGRVLVTGGMPASDPVASAQTYDETTGKWTTVASMKAARAYHAAVRLADGRVLVAGGASGASATAEVYDPAKNTWTVTGAMTGGHRLMPAAALLGDGRVLVSGGVGPATSRDDVYDPKTNGFTQTGITDVVRIGARATTLKDGRVLVTGGRNPSVPANLFPRKIDIFDPVANAYLNSAGLGFMKQGRANHTASLLDDGRVLVVGGNDNTQVLLSAEVYDVAGNSWSTLPNPVAKRAYHQAEILDTGHVLVMGGLQGPGPATTSTELFDPKAGTFAPFAPLLQGRTEFVAAKLPSGRVLVAGGGADPDNVELSSAEIVAAFANGKACTASAECLSGFCVDGLCCDKACDGQCEACDASGSEGTCTPIDGEPHGARPKCPAAPAGEPCLARRCQGGKDVKTCAGYASITTECRAQSCDGDAYTGPATCDGAGACIAVAPKACAPYACGGDVCRTQCTAAADCAEGYQCKDGACVPEGATCSDDGRSSIGKDGKVTPCGAYRCGGDGLCVSRCADSSACAEGYVCNTASGECAALPPSVEDEGGCAVSGAGGAPTAGIALVAALAAMAGRVARQRRSGAGRR